MTSELVKNGSAQYFSHGPMISSSVPFAGTFLDPSEEEDSDASTLVSSWTSSDFGIAPSLNRSTITLVGSKNGDVGMWVDDGQSENDRPSKAVDSTDQLRGIVGSIVPYTTCMVLSELESF